MPVNLTALERKLHRAPDSECEETEKESNRECNKERRRLRACHRLCCESLESFFVIARLFAMMTNASGSGSGSGCGYVCGTACPGACYAAYSGPVNSMTWPEMRDLYVIIAMPQNFTRKAKVACELREI